MNKITLIKTISLAISFFIAGCDVTSNNPSSSTAADGSSTNSSSGAAGGGGGGGGQEGDPVVVDFPIAYIQRPVPVGFANEDDVQMSVLSDDVFDPTAFRPGAQLVIKQRASVAAEARVITASVFVSPTPTPDPDAEPPADPTPTPTPTPVPLYDVRDLSVNTLGTKLLFSMRAPEIENAEEEDQPTWNIWEYDIESDTLTRIIESNIVAEQGHDRFPAYLPDDSIVFSSTRQRTSKTILLDQSRPQYAYVTEHDDDVRAFTLHRIDEERNEIEQISYGKGHDIYPSVLDDGRIMFMRGDDTSNTNRDRLSLYTMHPDGSNLSLHYGFHSPSSQESDNDDENIQGALVKPVELPDGRIMVSYRPRESGQLGGDIYAVDTANYIDITQPTPANTGAEGPAEESLSIGEVVLEGQSPHGHFNSAYPLFDNTDRLLVSWMPCLVQGYRLNIYVDRTDTDILDEDDAIIGVDTRYELINIDGEYVDRDGDRLADGVDPVEIGLDEIVSLPCSSNTFDNDAIEPSEPQYGVWIYDATTETQSPVVIANVPGIMYTEAVVFEPRTAQTFIPDAAQDEFTLNLKNESVGILKIRSIYDFDGTDVTPDGIAAMADPLRTAPDNRVIRFIRFYEEANMPHEDDYEIEGRLVSGRNGQPSRSIIGYAQVHPDGSVMTKVPANVQFSMEFLDADGHRVTGAFGTRHRYWINLRPGETRECNGCHSANSTAPHGRTDAQLEPVNQGSISGTHFPNTVLRDRFDSPYPEPEVGETMAEYYIRIKLADPPPDNADEYDPLALSLNLTWTDEWTDPDSGATPGTDVTMEFGDPEAPGPDNLQTLPPVLIGDCLRSWNARCRIVIDYPDHIQPIYEVDRVRNINGEDVNITCTNCHSTVDPDGNTQVPAPDDLEFQLDFTPIISPLDDDMVFLKGYDEFFAAGERLQALDDNGNLAELRIPRTDVNGNILYIQVARIRNNVIEYQAIDQFDNPVCAPLEPVNPDLTFILDDANVNVACLEDDCDRDPIDGSLIPDPDTGLPVCRPQTDPIEQNRYLNNAGANSGQNQRFFNAFGPGGAHEGYLTPGEWKLFSEWLDMGGQYYNEIFKALDD